MKKIYLSIALLLAFTACIKPNADHVVGQNGLIYFDLKGFIKQQAEMLEKENSRLRKEILVNGQTETKELASVKWAQELRPFANADINKPVLAEAYSIGEYVENGKRKVAYTAKHHSQEVKRILVTYTNAQVSEIEIDYSELNPVYDSKREMHIVLDNGLVQSYKVFGYQKMKLQDTLAYQLTAKVVR